MPAWRPDFWSPGRHFDLEFNRYRFSIGETLASWAQLWHDSVTVKFVPPTVIAAA